MLVVNVFLYTWAISGSLQRGRSNYIDLTMILCEFVLNFAFKSMVRKVGYYVKIDMMTLEQLNKLIFGIWVYPLEPHFFTIRNWELVTGRKLQLSYCFRMCCILHGGKCDCSQLCKVTFKGSLYKLSSFCSDSYKCVFFLFHQLRRCIQSIF